MEKFGANENTLTRRGRATTSLEESSGPSWAPILQTWFRRAGVPRFVRYALDGVEEKLRIFAGTVWIEAEL